ncbi:MAG: hypothetical protein H0W11_09000 [Gemmatimonadetes bacterium]|nr:hypothetical protein [Gemmatimonadota bacterium]
MRRSLTLLLLMAVGACDRAVDPVAPGPDYSAPVFSATMSEVSQDPTPSQAAVAQAVPGFGGYFLDESGAPTVYLTDTSRRPEAEQALAGFLASRGFAAADLRVRQGSYDYLQLEAWYNTAWPKALAVSGAVFSDLDEANNRLRFGAASTSAVLAVQSALALLGIPSAAMKVDQVAPIYQLATLRDRIRPAHGGLQLNFIVENTSPVSYLCTLGFNAVKDGVNSFVTNSHCTNVQGGSEIPTTYYQATRNTPDNIIGFEVDDPHYWISPDCPIPGFMCRYSDAARAEYAEGQEFAIGRVARPVLSNNPAHPDMLTIDAANPTFRIVEEQAYSVVGESANKVGRTTGWTSGLVTETCINSIVLGAAKPIIQLCQTRVQAGVDSGDSGSPVFRVRPDGNVVLQGILWGGSVSGTPSFVFSPMFGVERELGLLDTTDPISEPTKPGNGKGGGKKS